APEASKESEAPEAPVTAEDPAPASQAAAAGPDGGHPDIDAVAPEALPARWRDLADHLARLLGGMPSPEAPQALDDAARPLTALAARSPDLAVFLLVRPGYEDGMRVGVVRSLQSATAAALVGRRTGWPAERQLTLVKAALTMNLGMLELQERLSNQARLPDP